MEDNKEYTEIVLPLIIQLYDLKNTNSKFVEVMEFIESVEYAASQSEIVASKVIWIYHVIHLN